MDRNLDVLWEIILSLISLPSPRTLYNLLAANPTAFAIFCLYGAYPVARRIESLEDAFIALIERTVTRNVMSVNATEAALFAAEKASTAGGTEEEVAAAVELARKARAQAFGATQKARDIMTAMLAIRPVLLERRKPTAGKPAELPSFAEGNAVVDEMVGVCSMLVQWRRFRDRLFESAVEVVLPQPKSQKTEPFSKVKAGLVKGIQKHGVVRFGEMWKRKFFRLEKVRVRRSARLKAKAATS